MPTYNRPDSIRESIESVLAQTFEDFELIIINDGGSRDVENTLAACSDSRIRYHYAEHGGLSRALNVGLALAVGKYIAYLDDDDIYYSNHLETVMAHFDAHPTSAVAYTNINRAEQEMFRGELRMMALIPYPTPEFERDQYLERNYTPVLSVVHRRDCIDASGPFNESIEFGMDWDLWIRMSRKYTFTQLPGITGEFRWRLDGSNMSTNRAFRQEYYNNAILWLHGGFLLASNFLDKFSPGDRLRADAGLRYILGQESFPLVQLPLRVLHRASKPYRFFYALGKDLLLAGQYTLARAAFAAARKAAPLEPKLYTYGANARLRSLFQKEKTPAVNTP